MNEKSGADWTQLAAREIYHCGFGAHSIRQRAYDELAAIITKHLPSGDVGKLREALTDYLKRCRECGGTGVGRDSNGDPYQCQWCDAGLIALASVPANPPQVDTTLEEIETSLRERAQQLQRNLQYGAAEYLISAANGIAAHARKSQPKEGVVNVETARTLCVLDIAQPPSGMELCSESFQEYVGGKLNELVAIVRAESAAVPSMEDECSRLEFISSTKQLLDYNGGLINGDNGIEYVMVRRIDFSALEKLYNDSQKARKEGGK